MKKNDKKRFGEPKKQKKCCCKLADHGNQKKKQAGRLIANFQLFSACLGL